MRIKALEIKVKTVAIMKLQLLRNACTNNKTEQRENTQYKTFQEYMVETKQCLHTFKIKVFYKFLLLRGVFYTFHYILGFLDCFHDPCFFESGSYNLLCSGADLGFFSCTAKESGKYLIYVAHCWATKKIEQNLEVYNQESLLA